MKPSLCSMCLPLSLDMDGGHGLIAESAMSITNLLTTYYQFKTSL